VQGGEEEAFYVMGLSKLDEQQGGENLFEHEV
jgi:hypothetical protein